MRWRPALRWRRRLLWDDVGHEEPPPEAIDPAEIPDSREPDPLPAVERDPPAAPQPGQPSSKLPRRVGVSIRRA